MQRYDDTAQSQDLKDRIVANCMHLVHQSPFPGDAVHRDWQ